jgi:hypothetical protein
LIEVMLSSVMMLMLLFAFYGVAEALQRSQLVSDGRVQARQALRNGLRAFQLASAEATAFFPGNGSAQTIGGYSCRLPAMLASGSYDSGDTVAVAVPVDISGPADPGDDPRLPSTVLQTGAGAQADGFPDNRYDILVLTTRSRRPADSRNPAARQLVLMRWENVQPVSFLAPLTIDLQDLGAPVVERVFDTYLKAASEDGFRIGYQSRGGAAAACSIHAGYSYRPRQGAAQEETYEALFNTRDIF